MRKADEYTYRVFWSKEDGEFVGKAAEFPLLSYVGDSPQDTLMGIIDVVENAIAVLEEEGREVPEPMGAVSYSGHYNLRMTPETHREIAMQAAEQQVSINRLINSKLCVSERV